MRSRLSTPHDLNEEPPPTETFGVQKPVVRRHFNRHAEHYDEYAGVQRQMADTLLAGTFRRLDGGGGTERTSSEQSKLRILEIGCGTGYVTARLAAHYPQADITAIELAPQMIDVAKRKLERIRRDKSGSTGTCGPNPISSTNAAPSRHPFNYSERAEEEGANAQSTVRFLEADAEEAWKSLQTGYDLIVSNATFQWFNQPEITVPAYIRLLRPGGHLAFSTFGPANFQELHAAFRAAEQELGASGRSHGQAMPDEAQWRSMLAEASGRGTLELSEQFYVETYPGVRDFLLSVQRMGASNAQSGSNSGGLSARRLLNAMERHYAERYSGPDGIRATFHGYIVFYTQSHAGG